MIDHVDHEGFLYRMAYPFSHKPQQVQVCQLPWRALGMGIWRLVVSLVMWVFLGSVVGIFFWIIFGIGGFLLGLKFFYRIPKSCPFDVIIGEKLLNRLIFLNYDAVPIEKLPVVAGKRVLPIYMIAALAVAWALWYIVPAMGSTIVSGVPGVWLLIRDAINTLLDWQFWAKVLTFVISTIVTVIVYGGFQKFKKSETWDILKAALKARKEKWCPIVPVI